jgi:fibrillarin-like rRNA methylase
MFVTSEFDIFASKPVQECVHETVDVVYKPIASVDQSDLEFLIPADNETYIDPDIKVYIRGKETNIDATALDDNDFTSVTNNLQHSLFSQCPVSLNGTTITRTTELYNYRSLL